MPCPEENPCSEVRQSQIALQKADPAILLVALGKAGWKATPRTKGVGIFMTKPGLMATWEQDRDLRIEGVRLEKAKELANMCFYYAREAICRAAAEAGWSVTKHELNPSSPSRRQKSNWDWQAGRKTITCACTWRLPDIFAFSAHRSHRTTCLCRNFTGKIGHPFRDHAGRAADRMGRTHAPGHKRLCLTANEFRSTMNIICRALPANKARRYPNFLKWKGIHHDRNARSARSPKP